MKKICPYCGRKGELGVSCKGCGYVLSEKDKDVPGEEWKSYMDNFWEMPVSPKNFRDRRAASISLQFLNVNITANTSGGDMESDEKEGWRTAGKSPEAGQDSVRQKQEDKPGSGGFLIGLLGIILILYGSYGFTRMLHFFPDGRPLDGIVGASLMAAFALTGLMCIRPLRLRLWKAVRWPIALGYTAAIGIPLALMIMDLAATL